MQCVFFLKKLNRWKKQCNTVPILTMSRKKDILLLRRGFRPTSHSVILLIRLISVMTRFRIAVTRIMTLFGSLWLRFFFFPLIAFHSFLCYFFRKQIVDCAVENLGELPKFISARKAFFCFPFSHRLLTNA